MYYMKIEIRKYTRAAWNQIGSADIEHTVVLPMAMQLIDSQSVKYSDEPLGVSGAIGLGAGAGVMNILNQAEASKSISGTLAAIGGEIKKAGNGALNNTLGFGLSKGLDAISAAGLNTGKGLMAAAGMAQNEFLTVMLEGPNYKVRSFQWVLSPNSSDETETLRKIVQLFNNAQAPTLSPLGYAFFQYPRIFNISFRYKGDADLGNILFRMRPMVLLDAQYNYTPHGVFSPFAATQGPNAIELQLKFQELELWVNNSDTDLAYKDGGPTPATSADLIGQFASTVSSLGTGAGTGASTFGADIISGNPQ